MFGTNFYNETTRRYVAVFGTLFNDIVITRKNNSGTTIQSIPVPVNYGPMQKFLAKLEQDPNLSAPAMTLPRITFEIVSMTYDGERKLNNLIRNTVPSSTDNGVYNTQYAPAPYNLEFQLNIMTKYDEDGSKIIEQILPYFKPEFTPTVKLIDELELYLDIPVILNSISKEDAYENDFLTRRSLIWTLNFTMKGYYFGPVTTRKVIKFANVNMYSNTVADTPEEIVRVRPGLTANGQPTSNVSLSVAATEINFEDNWAYISYIEDYTE